MDEVNQALQNIADSIRGAGYDPYEQIFGYVSTGNDSYITRKNNAREKIKTFRMGQVNRFLKELKKGG